MKLLLLQPGGNGFNNGGIYAGFGSISVGVPANILTSIVANQNKSSGAIFTVPAGKTWVISLFSGSFSSGGVIQFRLRNNLGLTYVDRYIPIPAAVAVLQSPIPMVLPEKTQVQVWAKATTITTSAATIFQGVLYTN